MAYIYKIINDINQKIYIGKTEFSIEKRFQEHCKDAFRERCEKRPLYSAMRKYGIEHFHIEQIEETDNPEERERYWIEYYGSFKNGYNATMGGDGKHYLDYDLIVRLYNEVGSIKKVSELLNASTDQISKILKKYHIDTTYRGNQKAVAQLDKNTNEIINVYSSTREAEEAMGNTGRHIAQVCLGKRKTTYGYKWKYI